MPQAAPQEGDIIAGKYRVERVLGSGGMGVVVAAHHLRLDERVALKFLLPEALESPEAVARFLQEARAASKIKNEHVARVTDVGNLEDGSPYMVMEYLEGSDLSRWLEERGPLPVEQAVDFVLQACEALGDAHMLGIVHRDLKPANLFCIQRSDGQPFIKVLDFGISKFTERGGHQMTKTSELIGSPLYMSPEQLRASKGVDARTDVWSLGVILFQLATGSPPFDAELSTELILKISADEAPPLGKYLGAVPAELEAVVARCLAKDWEHRYQSVGELARALQAFASKRGLQSVERILGAMQMAPTPFQAGPVRPSAPSLPGSPNASPRAGRARTASAWGQTGRDFGKGRKGLVAIGVSGAAVIAVGGWLLGRNGTSTTAASTATVLSASGTVVPPTAPQPAASVANALPPSTASVPDSVASAPPKPAAGGPSSAKHAGPVHPAQAPQGGPKRSCDPPYTVDSAGHHTYKKECL